MHGYYLDDVAGGNDGIGIHQVNSGLLEHPLLHTGHVEAYDVTGVPFKYMYKDLQCGNRTHVTVNVVPEIHS